MAIGPATCARLGIGTVAALVLVHAIAPVAAHPGRIDGPKVPDDAVHAGVPSGPRTVDFNRDVRPILVARCFACHGPDESTRERDLRLDLPETAVNPARPGRRAAIVPHDAEASLLIERVTDHLDPMPPSGEPLTSAEVGILRRWIDEGAAYEGHWSWDAIVDPSPPPVEEALEPFVRNDVDRFILARIAEHGLEPSGDASPARQLRRLAYDLTGLPPAPELVVAFEADPSEAHWDRLVDELLASPHFGERWGRHWLDLVRYAETYGHEFDYPIREAWRYRDWVVRAFNRDVPYDRFLAEQIAGDLLEPRINPDDGTNESVIGTGHWYLHQAVQAPTDVTQDQAERISNQLEVFGQGFLGLTVSCARCHDHKFDAISTRDYYALSGYMQSMHQGYAYLDPNRLIQEAVERLESDGPPAVEPRDAAPPTRLERYLLAAAELRPVPTEEDGRDRSVEDAAIRDFANRRAIDPDLLRRWIESFERDDWREMVDHPWRAWTVLGHDGGMLEAASREAVRRRVLPKNDLSIDEAPILLETFDAEVPDLRWYPSGWAWTGSGDVVRPVGGTLASDVLDRRLQGTIRSETFTLDHRYLHWRVRGTGDGVAIRLVVEGMMIDEFHNLLFQGYYQGVRSGDGWRHVVNDVELHLGRRAHLELIDNGHGRLEVDAIWMSDRPAGRLADQPVPGWVAASTGDDRARLASAFVADATDPTSPPMVRRPLRDRLVDAGLWGDTVAEADAARAAREAARHRGERVAGDIPEPVRVLAAHEGSGIDQAISIRGSHRTPGEIAVRGFISSISGDPPEPAGPDGSGRLALVDAVLEARNPFPARVMANRIWHHLFGRGLVATTDDFGGLGETPSHPALLDHLASRLREDWSIKGVIGVIARSSAYRRSSSPRAGGSSTGVARDLDRRLLAVAPIRRLSAESIRDAMLATSGRLDRTIGGASVPTHLTAFMNGRGRPAESGPLDGDGRRSLYLEVRRNFPNPMLAVFDFPVPTTVVGRRNTSNVPAQALALMNDPFVHEMAESWGLSILGDPDLTDDRARAERMWRQAFATAPTAEERLAIVDFVRADPDRERAWIGVAHAIYNAKSFVHLD